jgi:hypothetical protein
VEAALVEQQQHVEGVVDRLAGPVVAVVPGADLVAVQARKLRGEDLVQIGLGVAADGRVVGIEGDVVEVVEPENRLTLLNLDTPVSIAKRMWASAPLMTE